MSRVRKSRDDLITVANIGRFGPASKSFGKVKVARQVTYRRRRASHSDAMGDACASGNGN